MNAVPRRLATVAAVVAAALAARPGASAHTRSCHATTFTATVGAGARFEHAIGRTLTFRLDPDGDADGWRMTIAPTDAPADDYVYPVNPPLRMNGVQLFGPSYGEDARTSLSRRRDVRFLLARADFERLSPLVTNVLWPYSAPRPDVAADEYTTALKSVATGRLTVVVVSYELDPTTGSLRRMQVRAELTTPSAFPFAPGAKPRPATCPRPIEP